MLAGRSPRSAGGNLIAAYAGGSIGLGNYLPGQSDINVALVCEEPLQTKHKLVIALRNESIHCPTRGLELVVYQRVVAPSGRPDPGLELELNSAPV